MADPWDAFPDASPQGGLVIDITKKPRPGDGDAWAAFPDAKPQGALEGVANAVNTGVNWLGTQATKAGTGILGLPRAAADVQRSVLESIGAPSSVVTALGVANPITNAGQFLPSSEELNHLIFTHLAPEQKMPGPLGPAIDAGTQAALSTLVMPGSIARNVLPAFAGGAAQEAVGSTQGIKGTKLEPLVRLLTGLGVGGATSLGQNAAGNVGQAIKNLMPNAENTAAKLIGRAAANDKTTLADLLEAHGELGPGAPLVEAGGPNVRGLLRGAVTSPGAPRTVAQEVFDARRGQAGDIAATALDRNISPNGSASTTVNELEALQRQQAGPAYERAGVLLPTEAQPAGTRIRPEQLAPERTVKFAIDQPETKVPAQWNTMTMESPALTALYKDSSIVRSAMGQIKGLSEYKNIPPNTMTMWDQVYKVLGGMEREAARGGNDRRAMLIGDERRNVLAAITEQNPRYQRALDAYSGPAKLIDATERGKEWFKPGVDDATVRREFQALSEAEQQAARIGIRDAVRTAMDRSDKSTSGVAFWSSPANRAKLQAVLSPGEFADLERQMKIVKNAAATATDVNVGSRTAPMLADQANIASQAGGSGLADLLMGRPVRAAAKFGSSALGRITEGKTEAVNAKLADYLTATDAEKVGLVKSLAEKARQKELAAQLGRRNAVLSGGVVAPLAIGGGRQ